MRNKLLQTMSRRVTAGMLALLLLVGTVFAVDRGGNKVYAANDSSKVEDVGDVYYKVESHTDISEYRQQGALKAPVFSEIDSSKYLFAGWYTDQACTEPLAESVVASDGKNVPSGTYYAKYVPKEILSVKCQLRADINIDSTDTVLRCVSSVDSLNYKSVGLILVTPEDEELSMESRQVNTRIRGNRDHEDMGGYTYSPKAVDTSSEYFFSATHPIVKDDFNKGFLIKPYWVTTDGTRVYGVSRYVTVTEGINHDVVHIPVKMDAKLAESAAFEVNDGTKDITASYVAYDSDGGYAHLEVSDVPAVSATRYTIKDASGEVGTYIYRNMATEYNGENADTSWYDVYAAEGESKFVIATSADLYGFAKVVNGGNNFKGKTVYVVSDIEANTTTGLTAGIKHQWKKIGGKGGGESSMFAGTFDGQMHSIKNVRMDVTTEVTAEFGTGFYGFFGGAARTAVLKNFKLVGGIFNLGSQQQSGSILGRSFGAVLDTVYSDAKINSNGEFIGGLVGASAKCPEETELKNCWFDGSINNTASSSRIVGGLIGVSNYSSALVDCLNTGDITAENCVTIGGLIGQGTPNSGYAINIQNCLNTGVITSKENATEIGAILGRSSGTSTISNTYAVKESCAYMVNGTATYDGVTTATKANLTGTKAITTIPELFKSKAEDGEYDYRWVVVAGSTPVLKSFASETGKATMGVDTSWYDENEAEYVLKDAAELYGLAVLSREINFAGKTIKLGADITVNEGDAADWSTVAPAYSWPGIGTDANLRFNGTFDGDGHKISGLYVKTTNTYQGMFGNTAEGAVVKNFRLENSYFESTARGLGSIAGRGLGTFDTIYSDAIVVGKGASVGGLLGQGATGAVKMNNCWFAGTVTNNQTGAGNTTGNGTGGLIGNLNNTTKAVVTNCLNTGTVTANQYEKQARVGGLIGAVIDKDTQISHCVNAGEVICNQTAGYGAFAGHVENTCTDKSMFKNSYAVKEYCESFAAGYGGKIDSTTSKLVEQADAAGINAITNMPALFKYEEDGVRKNYWSVTADGAPVLTSFKTMTETSAMGIDISWYNAAQSKYVLNDAADLYGLALLSKEETFTGKTIELGADITVNEGLASTWASDPPAYQWIPIGYHKSNSDECRFNGTFNGKGHTISGLYLDSKDSFSGLFGLTDTAAIIKDFKLVNSYFASSKQAIGSIAGHTRGSVFDTIYSDAIVVGGHQYVGGLIGQAGGSDLAYTIKVDNCWFDGSVTNTSTESQGTGGLIGAITAPKIELVDCLNTGMVSAESYNKKDTTTNEAGETVDTESVTPRVGGMIGSLGKLSNGGACIVRNSLNTGKVVYNTEATTGYGSVIGRVTGLSDTEVSDNEALIIQDTYTTTKSCSNTVTSRDNLTKASVTTVEDTEITGADAMTKMPGLFTENGKWTTIENGMPVLSSFSKYAKVAGELSPLYLWLRNTASPRVTLGSPTTLSSEGLVATSLYRQGGYTDGNYFYQAYITLKNTGNESQNKVRILKQDLTGTNVPVFSEELLLGHANDITYNEKSGQLIVCHAGGNNITFINPETLRIIETKALGFNINNIAYNAARDCYVVGYPQGKTENGEPGNRPFGIVDRNFKQVAGPFVSNEGTWALTGQGASCDDDYIYLLLSEGTKDKRNVIAVYNWSGEFINLIHLEIQSIADIIEPENISVVGNTIYVSVAECWGTSLNPTKKEANVYSFTIE